MRKLILFIGLAINSFGLVAQTWEKGKILLSNGSMYEGDICYYPNKGIVLHQAGAVKKAFATSQIQQFSYFDDALRLKRYFANYLLKGRRRFFEQVIVGNYHFLKTPSRNFQLQDNTMDMEFFSRINDYFVWNGKKVIPVKQFKKQFASLFWKHGIDLIAYAKEKKMNTYLPKDQIKLIYQLNVAIEKEKILVQK